MAPILAMVVLLLAAVRLYAVIAHSISQRVKEIGVRMAIGATQTDIRQMVLREGMLPVLFGMTFGLAAALAVNNFCGPNWLESRRMTLSRWPARQ